MNVVLIASCLALALALLATSWLSIVAFSEYAEETDEFDNE